MLVAYLNPHPVPPRTMAATRMPPAMDPIMILVPLGPVTKGRGMKPWEYTCQNQSTNFSETSLLHLHVSLNVGSDVLN